MADLQPVVGVGVERLCYGYGFSQFLARHREVCGAGFLGVVGLDIDHNRHAAFPDGFVDRKPVG